MPRPKSKSELLNASKQNYLKLITLIDGFGSEKIESDFPPGTLNRNIRDVLGHLYHWHLLFFGWYKVGMSGGKPVIPAKGYTWKTTPDLNKWINDNYSSIQLSVIREKLAESQTHILALIEKHTDDELFEKKRFKWTGSTSLGAYFISATSSHYDWAIKLIKKATK